MTEVVFDLDALLQAIRELRDEIERLRAVIADVKRDDAKPLFYGRGHP